MDTNTNTNTNTNTPTREEESSSSVGASSGRNGGGGGLSMVSGSFYISKENASKLQGDDAHFICMEKQTIGVADGVGGWSSKGIDAGRYARELMTNAEIATQLWPAHNKPIDPYIVLQEAYSNTKAQGSSTACIITLEGNNMRAVNVGDSGFLLLRQGKEAFRSPIQQYRFNHPYQLGNSGGCSRPSDAQVFEMPVEAGDVIVAGTDGLFDNLFAVQIEEIVRRGMEQGLGPEEVAWTVAEQTYHTSMDREVLNPFTQAATLAQTSHRGGGKQDDITVIVSYILG